MRNLAQGGQASVYVGHLCPGVRILLQLSLWCRIERPQLRQEPTAITGKHLFSVRRNKCAQEDKGARHTISTKSGRSTW